MKKRIFRVTLALFFSLCLLFSMSASTVLAAESITVDPDEGGVGDEIEVSGTGFSTNVEVWIILSSQEAEVNDDINDEVTSWKVIGAEQTGNLTGNFTASVEIPEELTGGDDPEAVHGGPYFIYVTYQDNTNIEARTEFLVTGFSFLDIDKDDGIVGTEVEIIGEGFMENEYITVEYDDDDVTDDIDGADKTDGDGEFDFTFEIPESTVGDHTITVTDETGNKAEVTFTVEENLELSPDSGPPGTVIIVNGTGFGYREDFDRVRFNNVNILGDIDEDRTDRDGSFTFTYTIPATLGSGTYTLSVRDDDGNEADATFTIAVISNIDKTTGSVGETLTITGTGFTTGTAITVTYGGNPVTLSVSNIDTNGNLTAQFSAPASAAGPHNIVLIVGTHIKTFVFTMEAVPPDAPNLLLPLTGEKAKQPITFDWSDVTDDSGVTYILWVSNDTDFATLVLEKTGLTDSAYTMTEAEELASVSKDAPYYWSVRAVDNASNLGAWAASSTFTVGFSFDWPTWAWWVVGGVGGLIIILVFFWFGRRSITY